MGRKVAVVSDSEEAVAEVSSYLQAEKNYEVAFCELGPETMACIRKLQPEVIVLEVENPGPPLLRFVEVMRSDPLSSAIPIVLCCMVTPEVDVLLRQLQMQGIYMAEFPCDLARLAVKIEEAAASPPPPGAA